MATKHELYDAAIALKGQEQWEDAITKLNEALALDPQFALAHGALAVIQQRLGKHEEAVNHALQVCEIEPSDPFSYSALSVVCQRAYAGTGDESYIKKAEDAMARSHMIHGS